MLFDTNELGRMRSHYFPSGSSDIPKPATIEGASSTEEKYEWRVGQISRKNYRKWEFLKATNLNGGWGGGTLLVISYF